MAKSAGLENQRTRKGSVGSNPTPSANVTKELKEIFPGIEVITSHDGDGDDTLILGFAIISELHQSVRGHAFRFKIL